MAKMFYTLEEAAERLGKSTDDVKAMAESGELQQFRDRDQIMFKVDQIDSIAGDSPAGADDTGEITLADESSQTDTIDLVAETEDTYGLSSDTAKSATATGISVFDADEIDAADPMAQTQVTNDGGGMFDDDDELTLDTVGSGSGLLDLTRESDDTSLGAVELLEDIDPGAATGDFAIGDVPGGSTGLFEAAGAESAMASTGYVPSPEADVVYVSGDPYDPAGDWFGGIISFGTLIALVMAVIIAFAAVNGQVAKLTMTVASEGGSISKDRLIMVCMILLVAPLILGAIGFFIGRGKAAKAG